MQNARHYKRLMYEHEVLWARYDIRDHYLNKVVQEVYENIGQVLSLIRVQLNLLSNSQEAARVSPADPGNLVGGVIQDLRAMCRSFYPETELLAKLGLIQTLDYELKFLGNEKVQHATKVKGVPVALPVGTELIVFRMLQEMLFSVWQQYRETPILVKINYAENNVTFVIEYAGQPVEWKPFDLKVDHRLTLKRMNLPDRARLIDARLQVNQTKLSKTRIKLIVPFKTSIYA